MREYPPWGKDVGDERRVFQDGEHFVISEDHVWLPGVYDREETAIRAFDLSEESLILLRDRVNRSEKRSISLADLNEFQV